jgi:hypothetical protein
MFITKELARSKSSFLREVCLIVYLFFYKWYPLKFIHMVIIDNNMYMFFISFMTFLVSLILVSEYNFCNRLVASLQKRNQFNSNQMRDELNT